MQSESSVPAPMPPVRERIAALVPERIAALDVVRGVAVGGILFANVLVFFGLIVMPAERIAALPTAEIDRTAAFLERVFVEGKFYSIFSLLFGIGFGVQLARGGDAAVPRFKRRLKILLAIGAVHTFLIWAGDILMLYALLGFTMPWFARKPDRDLLRWALILLAVPTILYAVAVIVAIGVGGGAAAPNTGVDLPPVILAIFESAGTGGVKEALLSNLFWVVGRWADLFVTVRFPKVLGMFVLGLWLVRAGIATAPQAHRATLVRWALLGWGIGLPANVAASYVFERWAYLPPSPTALAGVVAQAVGFPLLALGYAATLTLLVVHGWRVLNVFAPVGRMALTNYLMHSVICIVLSRGFGFGLFWQIGAATAMAIAAGIVVAQIPLSALWLSRFRYGPVEWIWRRLTYREAV